MARAAVKEVVERQRRERGVAARAAAGDDGALAVGPVLLRQESHAIDAVLDVDHAPISIEPLAILAPESRAAAVIHVEYRDAATVQNWLSQRRAYSMPRAVGPP
jgi:hypothetical protein